MSGEHATGGDAPVGAANVDAPVCASSTPSDDDRAAPRHSLPRIPVVLRRDGLVLTAPEDRDVERILEACRSPECYEHLNTPWPYERAHAEFFAREYWAGSWAAGTAQVFVVREYDDGPLLATIELRHDPAGVCDVGFNAHPDARGRGVVTRALSLLVDWAFAKGIERVEWEAIAGNHASATVARRCGFTFDGTGVSAVCTGRHLGRPAWQAHRSRGDAPDEKPGWPGLEAPVAAPLPAPDPADLG